MGHRLWLTAVAIHRLGVVEIAPSPHHRSLFRVIQCFRLRSSPLTPFPGSDTWRYTRVSPDDSHSCFHVAAIHAPFDRSSWMTLSISWAQDYNKNSTPNKSQTQGARAYEVTSFVSTDCEFSINPCSKFTPASTLPQSRYPSTGPHA